MSWNNCGDLHMWEILEDTEKRFPVLGIIRCCGYGERPYCLLHEVDWIPWVELLTTPSAYFRPASLPSCLPSFLPPSFPVYLILTGGLPHCFLEKGGKHWCERVAPIVCLPCVPGQESNPQPRCVPWPVIKPAAFWLQDEAPTSWAPPARQLIFIQLD